MAAANGITLTLTEWQKRMIADHVRRTAVPGKIVVSLIDRRQWVMYRQPSPVAAAKGAWNLYLSDAQINKVSAALGGARISALTISPASLKSGAVAFR